MEPKQQLARRRQLVKRLKIIKRELEKWDELASEAGYSWQTTRIYIGAIRDKIDETLDYLAFQDGLSPY